ncbi:MAG: shikimate dehydrogenase [Candidatus Korarchaeum sp.]
MEGLSLDANTKLTCLLGHPVGHSASPAIHNASYRRLGLNAVYLAFDILRLKPAIDGLRELGAIGCNITIPHKEGVVELLDHVDEEAVLVGAVNVVRFGEEVEGFNTDIEGVRYSLKLLDASGDKALILGAGGAARSVLAALSGSFKMVFVTSRNFERTKALASLCSKLGIDFHPLPWEERSSPLAEVDLVVNATPLGTGGGEFPLDLGKLRSDTAVLDLVYNPLETHLVREAKRRGCRAIGGLKMLVRQAAESERIWFDVEPDEGIMEEAALRFLGARLGGSEG